MKTATNFQAEKKAHRSYQAASRLVVLGLVGTGFFLACGGFWFANRTKPAPVTPAPETITGPILSATTQRILASLTTPLDLTFFAPDAAVALPESLCSYINRVSDLLAVYEREAAGKLRLHRRDPQTDAAAKTAATTAGVVPFASGTGEIVYLGLIVGNGARTEAITPLAPEWEAALESDLSRTIQRLASAPAAAASTRSTARKETQAAPIDPVISEQLLKMFPDLATRSYDAMAQELRAATLEEFKAGTLEMQTKVSAAQQTLADAQANKSAAEQQEALKQFQAVQAEQTEKLKEITAWLQARLTALQQLKATPGLSTPAR